MRIKEIENTETAMDDFQDFFEREAITPRFPNKDDADMAASLLSEALINAWEHGNCKDPQKRIFISWKYLWGGGLEISVRDEGDGFAPPKNQGLPEASARRGRGIFIISEFAESVRYNDRGNEITFIFRGEKTMENKYFSGYMVVLGLDIKEDNAREEIRGLRENLVKLTTDAEILKKQKDIYILINMVPFNVVSSTFFGDIGATLDIEQVKLIGLCGMQPTVKKIAKRMNVIQGDSVASPTESIEELLYKIQAFDTLQDGFNLMIEG